MSEYKNLSMARRRKNIEHPSHDWEPGPMIELASWIFALSIIGALVYIVWRVLQ